MTPATGRTLIFPVNPWMMAKLDLVKMCLSYVLEKNHHSTFFVFAIVGDIENLSPFSMVRIYYAMIGSLLGGMSIWLSASAIYRILRLLPQKRHISQIYDDDDVNLKSHSISS